MPRPSSNDIYSGGSEAFKRLNPSLTGEVPVADSPKAAARLSMDAGAQTGKPERVKRSALVQSSPSEEIIPSSSLNRARVHFYLFRNRFLDPDNATASIKRTLDAIVEAGLIVDDSAKWIDLVVEQIHVPKSQEGTGVTITYLPAPPTPIRSLESRGGARPQ